MVQRRPPIEVTVIGRKVPAPRGVRTRFIAEVAPRDLRRRDGLPIASPSLALLDLAGQANEKTLRRAINEARVQRLVTDRDLADVLHRHPNRKGAAALRRELRRAGAHLVTHSEAEARCLELLLSAGLAPDETQARIGPYRVDFLFRAERVVVEVDGFRFHETADRFHSDRRRTADLMARGYEVFPITWRDLTEDPQGTAARLRLVLERRRGSPGRVAG